MPGPAQASHGGAEAALCCPCCNQRFNNGENVPLILPQPCNHNICHCCLQKDKETGGVHERVFSREEEKWEYTVVCPVCDCPFQFGGTDFDSFDQNLVDNLSVNLALLSIIDSWHPDDDAPPPRPLPTSLTAGFIIPPEDLRLTGEVIGEGGFGKVVVAFLKDHVTGGEKEVAAKCVAQRAIRQFGSEDVLELVRSEIRILCHVSKHCTNVCRLLGVAEKDDETIIVMNRYKGSISDEMKKCGGKLPLKRAIKYALDICQGVAELHEHSVYMRDIKPENFLVDAFDHAAVADFGVSKVMEKYSRASTESIVGTPLFMSPEEWQPSLRPRGELRYRSDSWSFACSFVLMVTGKLEPFNGMGREEIREAVLTRKAPRVPNMAGTEKVPPPLVAILRRCFDFDCSKRPTFKELHQKFQEVEDGDGGLQPDSTSSSPNSSGDQSGRRPIHVVQRNTLVTIRPRPSPSPPPSPQPSVLRPDTDTVMNRLHELIEAHNRQGVRELLRQAPTGSRGDILNSLRMGVSALHKAASLDLDILEEILQYKGTGLDLEKRDRSGDTAIINAAFENNEQALRLLAAAGANLEAQRDSTRATALHVAAGKGHEAACQALLDHNASVQARDSDGRTPLFVATVSPSDLAWAIAARNPSAITIPDNDGLTPIDLCIGLQKLPLLASLLEIARQASASRLKDALGRTSSLSIMELLLQALGRDDLDRDKAQAALSIVARYCPPSALNVLISRGSKSLGAMHLLAGKGLPDCVNAMIRAGADVNIRSSTRTTPLFAVLSCDDEAAREKVVAALLNGGLDPNLKDEDGDTAINTCAIIMHQAQGSLKNEAANTLLYILRHSHTASIDISNAKGVSARWIINESLIKKDINLFSGDLKKQLAGRGITFPASSPAFSVDDWVRLRSSVRTPRYGWPSDLPGMHTSVGIVNRVDGDGDAFVAFAAATKLMVFQQSELEEVRPLQLGDVVRVKSSVSKPRYDWAGESHGSIGPIGSINRSGTVGVVFRGWERKDGFWTADPSELELVHRAIRAGDWVYFRSDRTPKYEWGQAKYTDIGIVEEVKADVTLAVRFSWMSGQASAWNGHPQDMGLLEEPPFAIGDRVKVKPQVLNPRFGWGGVDHSKVGTVIGIDKDTELRVQFHDRPKPWSADPSQMMEV